MLTDDDDGEVYTWREVAAKIPPDVLHAIVFGPPPPWHARALQALLDWWHRPRGVAAVIAAQGAAAADTIRALQGLDDAEWAAEQLWEAELRRRHGWRGAS